MNHLDNRLRPHPAVNVHSAFPATVSLHDANMVESGDSQLLWSELLIKWPRKTSVLWKLAGVISSSLF